MSYLAFALGFLIGFCFAVLVISLLCMAGRTSRELQAAETDFGLYPPDPAAGYHPGSLSDPRD